LGPSCHRPPRAHRASWLKPQARDEHVSVARLAGRKINPADRFAGVVDFDALTRREVSGPSRSPAAGQGTCGRTASRSWGTWSAPARAPPESNFSGSAEPELVPNHRPVHLRHPPAGPLEGLDCAGERRTPSLTPCTALREHPSARAVSRSPRPSARRGAARSPETCSPSCSWCPCCPPLWCPTGSRPACRSVGYAVVPIPGESGGPQPRKSAGTQLRKSDGVPSSRKIKVVPENRKSLVQSQKIIAPLHIEPEVWAVAKDAGKDDCGCRRHTPAVAAQFIEHASVVRPSPRRAPSGSVPVVP
jgi:hypothetical protein